MTLLEKKLMYGISTEMKKVNTRYPRVTLAPLLFLPRSLGASLVIFT